jgi:peptide/nickel transport system ATP-binding protein
MSAQLAIEDLSLEFRTRHGTVRALEDVALTVERGEIVGVVGESGSGKSVMAYAVMGLNDRAAEVTGGRITFGGLDVLSATPEQLAATRGREIAMIFQSPRTSLNPIRKVGRQIEDILSQHMALRSTDLKPNAVKALARVRIADPERRYNAYPFELSGGMCQRVMIAMALACSPSLLIADEPTTGLDVTTQAVIMDLIRDMSRSARMSTLLITHDLGLAGEYCDRIVVMHAGHVVEVASTGELLTRPAHPYTRQLLAATPTPRSTIDELTAIPGQLPDLRSALPACRFSARCERHEAACEQRPLPWTQLTPSHLVRCRVPS